MQGNKLINKKEQAIKGDQSTYNCGCGRSQQKKIKEKTTPPRLGHYCDIMSYLLLELIAVSELPKADTFRACSWCPL